MKFPDNYQGLDFQGAHYTVIDTVYKRKHHNTLQRFVGLFFFPLNLMLQCLYTLFTPITFPNNVDETWCSAPRLGPILLCVECLQILQQSVGPKFCHLLRKALPKCLSFLVRDSQYLHIRHLSAPGSKACF